MFSLLERTGYDWDSLSMYACNMHRFVYIRVSYTLGVGILSISDRHEKFC